MPPTWYFVAIIVVVVVSLFFVRKNINYLPVPVLMIILLVVLFFLGLREQRKTNHDHKVQSPITEAVDTAQADNQSAVKEALQQQIEANKKEIESQLLQVEYYGEGVYFFPCSKLDFRKALVLFIQQHPELLLVCIDDDQQGNPYSRLGKTVVFRQKPHP